MSHPFSHFISRRRDEPIRRYVRKRRRIGQFDIDSDSDTNDNASPASLAVRQDRMHAPIDDYQDTQLHSSDGDSDNAVEAPIIQTQDANELAEYLLDQSKASASSRDDIQSSKDPSSIGTLTRNARNDNELAFLFESTRLEQDEPAIGDFDIEDRPTTLDVVSTPDTSTSMSEPSRRSSLAIEETATPVNWQVSRKPVSDLEMAFGTWASTYSVTRAQWTALHQILYQVTEVQQLKDMPSNISAIKRDVFSQLPLIRILEKKIPVSFLKQPSRSAPDKNSAVRITADRKMFFFDMTQLIPLLVRSANFMKRIHIGMAHFVDEPCELWHSRSWASSIRSSSGQFVYFSQEDAEPIPLFPSDIIYYRCEKPQCQICSASVSWQCHTARILQFGKDLRRASTHHGHEVLLVQTLLRHQECEPVINQKCDEAGVSIAGNEFIVSESSDHYILPSQVVGIEDDFLYDYRFGLPEGIGSAPSTVRRKVWIRRIWDGKVSVRPLNLSHPIRAELELKEYGRRALVETLQKSGRCISLPMMCFIDEFGLYRNMYRSLLGIYWIPAGLCASDRQRRQNVYTITLGPHGADFKDVIETLRPSLHHLDQGLQMDLNGEPCTIIAFTMAFIGDMPQQEKNSGFLGHSANRSCRFCTVSKDQRGDVDFDIVNFGRYHFSHLSLRNHQQKLPTAASRSSFGTAWGISDKDLPLQLIAPALDLILTRPSDPAHSEFKGMASLIHDVLIDAILTDQAKPLYLAQLQNFPFPPGWSKLQSPLHHRKSYTMSENGRASVIIPLLLRCWLKADLIQPYYLKAIGNLHPDINISRVDLIVQFFADFARSVSLLTSRCAPITERDQIKNIIVSGRSAFRSICQAAADASLLNPRTRNVEAVKPRGRRATRASSSSFPIPQNSPSSSRASSMDSQTSETTKQTGTSKEYSARYQRPNFHIGLHYPEQFLEYATPNNCNTLAGEERHKKWKGFVTHTNHHLPEKSLIYSENIDRTLELVLDGVFASAHPDLTTTVQQLARESPGIFPSGTRFEEALTEDELDGMEQQTLDFVQPSHLSQVTMREPLSRTWIEQQTFLPVRLRLLDVLHPFLVKLREAFRTDYGGVDMILPDARPVVWCCKLSASMAGSSKRSTIRMNDFITSTDGRKARIFMFLICRYGGARYVFALVNFLASSTAFDPILKLPLRKLEAEHSVIGLPRLTLTRSYLIPVKLLNQQTTMQWEIDRQHPGAALECTWEVRFV